MASDGASSAGSSLEGRAIDLLRAGVFPNNWKFVPVAGKATYIKEWATRPLSSSELETAYKCGAQYHGLGVLTGEFSGGLIALDIDGEEADARYRAAAGAEYQAFGQESTMSWTSGKPGRRQILWQVPPAVVKELRHVKTLILRMDGSWSLGTGDEERVKAPDSAAAGAVVEYQEVVLRFNHCQSVVPGSPHPDTHKRYRFLNYNGGSVQPVPDWVMTLLRDHRKPVQWLSDEDQKAVTEALSETLVPARQIRGWFFKEEVQRRLMPRLDELVFNDPVFSRYGWKERAGDNPQRMSGCPWHGGSSGTAFQYSTLTGCWDCKACGIGGDVLDFLHKSAKNNPHAGRPMGPDLERYVAEIAQKLGYSYPEDLQRKEIVERPRTSMSEREFLDALGVIHDEERNPAIRMGRMAALAQETGRRLSGRECLAAMDEHLYYEQARSRNDANAWYENLQGMRHTVPNLLMAPAQVVLHAAGGLGKTSACMGLAVTIGRGRPMKVRGIEVPVRQGPVLWIQNDQNPEKLLRDCEDNGINPAKDKWFVVRRGFQMNHTHEFTEWIREIRPALVVVDSIGSCSTKMQVEEKDKAFAHPLYFYANMNGDPDGFPSTSIIWIHHDNAKGDVRGTKYLINAIDEQWHLRALKEQERDVLRQKGKVSSNCRMIEIKKSRVGRNGDLLVVERDRDFAYSVEDYTPTLRREDEGQGDPEPHTMMLDIVKQSSGAGKGPLTAKEVWEVLVGEMGAQNRQAPSVKTVRRHLQRWAQDGMLVLGKGKREESDRPVELFSLARASCSNGVPLSLTPSKPLQGLEKAKDNPEGVSLAFLDPQSTESKGQPDSVSFAFEPENDCAASDLEKQGPKDTASRTTRAGAREDCPAWGDVLGEFDVFLPPGVTPQPFREQVDE